MVATFVSPATIIVIGVAMTAAFTVAMTAEVSTVMAVTAGTTAIAAIVTTGMAIANIMAGGSRPRSSAAQSLAHVQWCYDRYRSYRASDNTYQPYNGPRRQCVSPY
jgi:amino acid transporter